MKPFTINISDHDLNDLKSRLAQTRWTPDLNEASWQFGPDIVYMKQLVEYWLHEYDWRSHEKELNKYPQFLWNFGDEIVHFLHIKSSKKDAKSLLMLHGWPDSFIRFKKITPLLADFNLVIPSLPGFGFSTALPKSPRETSDLFVKLMAELGYDKFIVHGGDIGGIVARTMIMSQPSKLQGVHLTDAGYVTGKEENLSAAEQQFMHDTINWVQREGAYLKVQATKPQTLGLALNNSPAALAGWLVGMINGQAKNNDIDCAFGDRDSLITNFMIYWFTQTSASAAASYTKIMTQHSSETFGKVPVGISLFPRELQFPKEWPQRTMNVVRFKTMSAGGHFAALEEPKMLATEIKKFVAKL